MLRKASRSVSRLYDAALADAGVSAAQPPVLRTISRHEWLTLSQLAKILFMERTSLYRTLTPMIQSGWVAIKGGRIGEGHAKQVSLTRKGRALTLAANAHWEGVQTRMVESFGTERWESLHKDIAELAALGVELMT